MYRIYFVNFDYTSQNEGKTLEEAKSIARKAGFDSTILLNGNPIMSYSVISGFHTLGDPSPIFSSLL